MSYPQFTISTTSTREIQGLDKYFSDFNSPRVIPTFSRKCSKEQVEEVLRLELANHKKSLAQARYFINNETDLYEKLDRMKNRCQESPKCESFKLAPQLRKEEQEESNPEESEVEQESEPDDLEDEQDEGESEKLRDEQESDLQNDQDTQDDRTDNDERANLLTSISQAQHLKCEILNCIRQPVTWPGSEVRIRYGLDPDWP
ncbi:hypothetical protein BGX21_010278 [Mortierella sp. AD011]|nr:hypothetical protein BGX21_010278 [Mortierella sp. AD011]